MTWNEAHGACAPAPATVAMIMHRVLDRLQRAGAEPPDDVICSGGNLFAVRRMDLLVTGFRVFAPGLNRKSPGPVLVYWRDMYIPAEHTTKRKGSLFRTEEAEVEMNVADIVEWVVPRPSDDNGDGI